VLVRDTVTTPAPVPTWSRTDAAHYPVSVTGGATVLALRETSAPGWQFQGLPPGAAAPEHTTVEGWANAWVLPAGTHSGTLAYAPSKISRYALLLLPIAVLLALAEILVFRWWRRRRRRREPRGRREAPAGQEVTP